MFRLFLSMGMLGLSAVDPIGIAVMPLLLGQKNPFGRSFIFLSGSFLSLTVMGLLFAKGFGAIILRFENSNSWFVPVVEAIAGLVLIGIALVIFWRAKTRKLSVEPNAKLVKALQLDNWRLFFSGALLVIVQSVIDVVFIIAMVRIGQLHLNSAALLAATTTYAVAALALQLLVVLAYWLTPIKHRTKTLDSIHDLLAKYVHQVIIAISLLLGCLLLIFALAA